jgi:hypothetical protein
MARISKILAIVFLYSKMRDGRTALGQAITYADCGAVGETRRWRAQATAG